MPRQLVVKSQFHRAYQRLPEASQCLVDLALKKFAPYLQTDEAGMGLGIKHLGRRTYEFRAGLALRVICVLDKEQVVLALIGTHDEVRRYLKRL